MSFQKQAIAFFRRHRWALLAAVMVGMIYVAPYLFFIVSAGDQYRGIPPLHTANEDDYIARIREITDGHPLVGAFAFYEEKEQWPLTPPVAEMIYALPHLIFGISVITIVIASKFILPVLLFVLIYLLIYLLTEQAKASLLVRSVNAVAGALLVLLGYDLVDYQRVLLSLTGKVSSSYFLFWSRPVNPIMGAIFLFTFLICLWMIINRHRYSAIAMGVAGVFLALMMSSYFFSWGLAISVLAFLMTGYLLKRDYRLLRNLSSMVLAAVLLASPYWYISWQLSETPAYREILLRNGLFYTHTPLLNKILLIALTGYALMVFFLYLKRNVLLLWCGRLVEEKSGMITDWHLFLVALLLGSFWSFNQQVVTGRAIWPFHFVQYTIPLVMVAGFVLLYNVVRVLWPKGWMVVVAVIAGSAVAWGVYTQVTAYQTHFASDIQLQSYQSVFDWLNKQPTDCVVFVLEDRNKLYTLNKLIPAFTHCNIYISPVVYTLVQSERRHDGYLALLRLKGVTADTIEAYLAEAENRGEATGYFFSNWAGLHGAPQFPDVQDRILEERLEKLPKEYRQFMEEDFTTVLRRYRLDYIVSIGPLRESVAAQLPQIEFIDVFNGVYVYRF